MSIYRKIGLAAAVVLATVGFDVAQSLDGTSVRTTRATPPTDPRSADAERKQWLRTRNSGRRPPGRGGWSVRQGQRKAAKIRNRAANRAAHR